MLVFRAYVSRPTRLEDTKTPVSLPSKAGSDAGGQPSVDAAFRPNSRVTGE